MGYFYHVTDVIVAFHFGLIFARFTLSLSSLTALKKEISKNWKTKTTTKTWRYHHFTQKYQKSWSYAILLLKYTVRDGCNCYFSYWAIFCPFTTLTAWKMKISGKRKEKTPRGMIILHKCTKNDDHMLYCSLDMMCDRYNYLSFWDIFYPVTP